MQAELGFTVLDARAEKYTAAPMLTFRLRIEETAGVPVQALLLRTQIRIEPQRRAYSYRQQKQLFGLFSDSSRWAETLKPFLWTHVFTHVPRFEGATEVDLPVSCSYDLETGAGSYFHIMRDEEIPLLFLFSGQVFAQGPGGGLVVQPISWACEAEYTLPAGLWRKVVDLHFPNSGWLRLQRETLDRLEQYKASRACPTWDAAMAALLEEASKKDVPA